MGGHLFVFVEYLCKRSPKIKTKNIKNHNSILAIVNHRNWLDDSPPLITCQLRRKKKKDHVRGISRIYTTKKTSQKCHFFVLQNNVASNLSVKEPNFFYGVYAKMKRFMLSIIINMEPNYVIGLSLQGSELIGVAGNSGCERPKSETNKHVVVMFI